jgi:hypothetical protein
MRSCRAAVEPGAFHEREPRFMPRCAAKPPSLECPRLRRKRSGVLETGHSSPFARPTKNWTPANGATVKAEAAVDLEPVLLLSTTGSGPARVLHMAAITTQRQSGRPGASRVPASTSIEAAVSDHATAWLLVVQGSHDVGASAAAAHCRSRTEPATRVRVRGARPSLPRGSRGSPIAGRARRRAESEQYLCSLNAPAVICRLSGGHRRARNGAITEAGRAADRARSARSLCRRCTRPDWAAAGDCLRGIAVVPPWRF